MKTRYLTCPCHKIYKVKAVDLCICKIVFMSLIFIFLIFFLFKNYYNTFSWRIFYSYILYSIPNSILYTVKYYSYKVSTHNINQTKTNIITDHAEFIYIYSFIMNTYYCLIFLIWATHSIKPNKTKINYVSSNSSVK